MPLPIVTLPTQEKWDCHHCGACCRGTIIHLSEDDLKRVQSQHWERHPEFRGVRTIVRYGFAPNRYRLAHRSDGSCVFLNEKGLCSIHSEHGSDAKPTLCRVFPLQLVPRGNQFALTVRRSCPSSASDLGQSTVGHLPFIEQLVDSGRLTTRSIPPPFLKAREQRDWKTLRIALNAASRLLQDNRYPPVRRLVHALQFANLLQKARTQSMPDEKLAELFHALEEIVAEESKPFFEERRKPTAYACVFFRQIAMEFARLHPEFRMRSKLMQRLRMMNTGWIVFRGLGPTPNLGPPFPSVHFEELEKPFDKIGPSVDVPLARLIETLSESYLYAIADRHGWSWVDSIRGLAVLFPVGLWLLRWVSHGREPTVQDMIQIVVALDRGQGFRPLNGSLHRWRLSTLSAQGELERLVVWYAR